GVADDEAEPLEELDVLGRTAVLDGERAGLVDLPLRDLRRGRDDERRLGVRGSEPPARLRRSGLEQQRSALRRRRRQVRALDAVTLALVEDLVDLRHVGVHAALLVLQQRAVVPRALP